MASAPASGPSLGSAYVFGLVGGIACVTGLIGVWGGEGAGALVPWLAGIPLLGLATYSARCRRGPPLCAPVGGETGSELDRDALFMPSMLVIGMVGFAALSTVFVRPGSTDETVGFLFIGAAFGTPLALAGLLLFLDQALIRRFRAALGAPALSEGAASGPVAVEGRLVDGSLSLRREDTMTERSGTEYVKDPSSNRVERRSTSSTSSTWKATARQKGSPTLAADAGTLRLVADGAWLVTLRSRFEADDTALPGGHRTSESSSSSTRTGIWHGWTEPDDRLLVFATPTDDRLRDVQLVVAAPPDVDPRAALRTEVSRHLAAIGVLVVLSPIGWALQWSYWPSA